MEKNLKNPWAGGMNSCQYCEIDLDLDGTNDLLVFDRFGNRKIPLVRNQQGDFIFTPEYALRLPAISDWVQTADYNNDGKMDIFTYRNGGICVYRNISVTTLQFELVTDMIQSWYYTGYVGILVTSVDYPAIADIDGDGDLDILTFFGLGSFVEYHKNLSKEKYGHSDSLDFRLADPCWGHFRESESGNRITLHIKCPQENSSATQSDPPVSFRSSSGNFPVIPLRHPTNDRHTGSTLLVTDLNNDSVADLILGDYGYPNLVALINGGTKDSAEMVSTDTLFPSVKPVWLFSFPSASLTDCDGNGIKDLVVSPFDPTVETSDNYRCSWLYSNAGTNHNPEFSFQTDSFLRNEMLDFGTASHPVLFDMDHDGLPDLLAGNDGYYDSSGYENGNLKSFYHSQITWFRNTGIPGHPVFKNRSDDLAGGSALNLRGLFPAPVDLNQDGITDLITGCSDGTLLFFKGTASSVDSLKFDPPGFNWQGIDVGEYSTPQFFDLDRDQVPDLIIGEKNGNFNWFRNNGTAQNPHFVLVTDNLGKINVTNPNLSWYGYSVPDFYRTASGETILAAGSEDGTVRLYNHIDQNLDGKFLLADTLWKWVAANPSDTINGWQTSPALGLLTSAIQPDMIVGNYSGGLRYFSKQAPPEIRADVPHWLPGDKNNLLLIPNPANSNVKIQISDKRYPFLDVEFYTFTGKKIFTAKSSENMIFSIHNLPDGIYLVRCGSLVGKLQIIHR